MRGVVVWMLLGVFALLHASVGQITLVVGEAHVVRGEQTLNAVSGMALLEKDSVNTQANGQVQMRFSDDTIISLGKNSSFSIDAYLNDAVAPQAKFGIAQGTFGVMTGKIGKIAPQNFNIQTKTATIGIRGTHFRGRTSEAGDVILCLSGMIQVVTLLGGASVDVPAGTLTYVIPGLPPSPPRPVGPADMEEVDDAPAEQGEGDTPTGGNEGPSFGDGPPPLPPLAQSALDGTLENNALAKIERQIGASSRCGAGYVGTSPNCQKITTAYAQPDYWTAPLAANQPAPNQTLSGFATYVQVSGGVTSFKHDAAMSLLMNDHGLNNGSIIDVESEPPIDLERSSVSTTMSYFNLNLNRFSILGFNAHANGWLQSENTVTNDYVSWGYWQIVHEDGGGDAITEPVLGFWVAGPSPTTNIGSLNLNSNPYTYTGKSIGYVYDSDTDTYAGINATTNNTVSLVFNFGSGTLLDSSSYIQF